MALTETETPRLIYLKYKPPFSGRLSILFLLFNLPILFPKWPAVILQVFFFLRLQQSWLTWWNCFVAARNGVWWTGKRFFFFFRVTDAAGCSLCWNESTHYVRAIAVFKISLTLRVIHLPCFWTDRDGGEAKRKEGKDWLEVIYKHCALWLPFPRLKHKTRLVPRCVLFFFCLYFTPSFSLRFFFFLHVHTVKAGQRTPPFLSHSLRHTQNIRTHTQCMHTHTQALLGYWTAIAVRSLLKEQGGRV